MKTFTGRSYLIKVMLALSAISFTFGIIHSESFAERTEPLIIDHTCTDLSMVPTHWMDQAKAMFKLSYGHTSHGSQIVTGMDLLKDPSGSQNWFDHDGTDGGLSLHDREPSGDLGNPDRTTWATRTQTLLDTSGCDRNMIMWSWCGQVDGTEAEINTYLNLMNGLEVNYPGVTFVYMTGHLNGTGEDGNVNIRNNQIRQYCRDNNKILFDFADIESYDPDGNHFLDRGATDGCNYNGGNWADEWCAANQDECESCSCAHSRCLNCQLKGRAFWWMMARLAGWETCRGDFDHDGEVDGSDLAVFSADFGRTNCGSDCEGDFDNDNDVDGSDLAVFSADFGRTDCP